MADSVNNPDVRKDEEKTISFAPNNESNGAPNPNPKNEAAPEEEAKDVKQMTYEEKIKYLLKNGYTKISKLKVRNVIVNVEDDYARITFVVNKAIPGFISDGDGNFTLGTTTNVFSSNYALAGCVKEDPNLAWLGNYISDINKEFDEDDDTNDIHLKAGALSIFFCGAEIDVLQTLVEKDVDYINPFTTSNDPTITSKDHQWFATNVIAVSPSKEGKRAITRFADKIMGF